MKIEAKQRRSGIAAFLNDERLAPDFRPASRVVGPCTSPGGGWRPISDGRSLPEASQGGHPLRHSGTPRVTSDVQMTCKKKR